MFKVSFIVPCFNCANTIMETLVSLLPKSNAIRHDYEIILVNDGSTDWTKDLLESFKNSANVRTTVIDQENQGVSVARNVGIKASQGEYIVFVDADDYIAPGFPVWLCETLNNEKPDTVAFYRIREREKLVSMNSKIHTETYSPIKLMKELTYSKKLLGFMTFAYKRDILLKNDIHFEPNVKYGEDWEFTTKYLANCDTALRIPYFTYYYRVDSPSASKAMTYRQTDAIGAADRAAAYLEENNHPFAKRFKEYMPKRALFSVAHRFAAGGEKALFEQLQHDYNTKNAMIFLSLDYKTDLKSRLGAIAYLVSPTLFFKLLDKTGQ